MFRTLALLLFPAVACAQGLFVPRSTSLTWGNLLVVISPDSDGVFFWASTGTVGEKGLTYGITVDPATANTWVADARNFLGQPLTEADSGMVRTSTRLSETPAGGQLYLARRRVAGKWSKERILVLESANAAADPIIVNTDDRNTSQILDSLEAVSRRSPPMRVNGPHDADDTLTKFDKPASLTPGNRPPAYPRNERERNHEGLVVVKFVVGTDGNADMSTVRVVHSEAAAFLQSVLETLPKLRFNPAIANGAATRQLVVMPFSFALVR